ncbi:hypothetical protein E4N85_02640 [Treponema denticola]|uniref:hypothetical protein n=1 Tax=Treponema denticola TaxID=158 RepID=UPI0020A37419|nr:hypothetical protein [Treponema denticola]UTC94195.1 hypothetical protein E4N85_02640 [Treponema denticola]
MLKRGKEKPYQLYKKDKKSFSKAPCEALDIKQPIGQNSQLHSFTASQLHSFTASQLHSLTASQPRNLAAEGLLCPNKTPKHTQIFSTNNTHKSEFPSLCVFYITPFNKPQGTQSVELRSTSQRNNQNVLRIETGQFNG